MKTNNPIIDSMLEAQASVINNWMDSAKKMQSSLTSGNVTHEGQNIVKEWFEKQSTILNGIQQSSSNVFGNNNGQNPQEVFKNWLNTQTTYAKQMTDFNQSILNSFNSFGKPAQDYISNFASSNNAWTNIYNSFVQTLNTTYDSLYKNVNGSFNKDIFQNFMQSNQVYTKMLEFFQPMISSMKGGQFNMEEFKNYFKPENYHNLTKQLFGDFYTGGNLKEFYDNSLNQVQNFFTNQNNLSKEYFAQVQNISKEFPQLFNGNLEKVKEVYANANNVFAKTFEPLLKVTTPGKEKESIEAIITLMDKVTEYSIKQSELQYHLQNTMRASVENVAKQYSEKFQSADFTKAPDTQEVYNEWIKTNEKLFADLFASEEFSKIKGETMNLAMDVKKHFEKQFESALVNFPVVVKSDVEELQKTIYDLKKQVKELQAKLNITSVSDLDDEKSSKKGKK
jgi:polyhydroxyalkanoate synthase subunit PhaE